MSGGSAQRGRPPIDKAARQREERRKVLHRGMLACYEVIDTCRKELAELDAADARGLAGRAGQTKPPSTTDGAALGAGKEVK